MAKRATPQELRQFGTLVGAVCGVIGVWPWVFRQEAPRWWAVGAGGLLMTLGILLPRSLTHVHRAWMKAGHVLGAINTKIILTVIYYGLVTPMGVVMRLFGRDAMHRAFSQEAPTYRVVRAPRPRHHMRNQF